MNHLKPLTLAACNASIAYQSFLCVKPDETDETRRLREAQAEAARRRLCGALVALGEAVREALAAASPEFVPYSSPAQSAEEKP